jgi:hypothetical protein
MAIRKSAMGRPVDMNALIAKNENVRAVGNMNVNARGDTIDSAGRVVNGKNARISKMYNKTVGNKPVPPKAPPKPTQPSKVEMTLEEQEFEDHDEDFVKEEPKKGKK